jgi:sarcosine oxidase delta subunit
LESKNILCPKCHKAQVREQTSIGGWFNKKKKIVFYCPLCEWSKKKEFKITTEDLELEMKERENQSKIKPPKRSLSVHRYITNNPKEKNIMILNGKVNEIDEDDEEDEEEDEDDEEEKEED